MKFFGALDRIVINEVDCGKDLFGMKNVFSDTNKIVVVVVVVVVV